MRNRKSKVRKGNRRGLEQPKFPLGLINLMLFGLVFVMVLIGAYMVMDEPSEAFAAQGAGEVTIEVPDIENANCLDYPDIKRNVRQMSERCLREVSGEFTDLNVFNTFVEQCQGDGVDHPVDPDAHDDFVHLVQMWRARCDRTDAGYASAIDMAKEVAGEGKAEHYELVLVQEFYIGYLRGHNTFTEGSTFEQDYPLEDHIGRDTLIAELTKEHTEPINERTIEYLQIDEEERYDILSVRFSLVRQDWMKGLAEKHVEAGYDQRRVYSLYFEYLLDEGEHTKARELSHEYLGGEGIDRLEDARIQKLLESGNYAVMEQPDGTRVRVFPMNDDVNVQVP